MRVAVMGTGGIGGLVGGRLASVGVEVLFIARGEHLRAMQHSGLRIVSQFGDVNLQRVDATDNPRGREPVDFVIFTVKGQDTTSAADLIAPLVGVGTGIICFQNGVEGIDVLAACYSEQSVLPGTAMAAAVIEAPGVIQQVGALNQFKIGEWNGDKTERVEAFRAISSTAGLDLTISDNIHTDVWSKFVVMATFSAITSLTRLPVKTLVSIPETRQLAIDSMDEVIAVAKGHGVAVPGDVKSKILAMAETLDPTWKTSMCNDLEAGKVIEIDSISGTLHRLGQELGVPTPIHSVAYRALKYYTMPKT